MCVWHLDCLSDLPTYLVSNTRRFVAPDALLSSLHVHSKRNAVPAAPQDHLAVAGQPLGILTIEDVIEELLRVEIMDETDQ